MIFLKLFQSQAKWKRYYEMLLLKNVLNECNYNCASTSVWV